MPKEKNKDIEQRNFQSINGLELREETDNKNVIGGYAFKYNSPTLLNDVWGDEYLEEISSGCFDESLEFCQTPGNEIKALWNHDMTKPLGNTKAGTLRFNLEDTNGLYYDIELPNNSWGVDAKESVKRGDVDGSSFGFICLEDKWSKVEHNGKEIYKRTITKAILKEVSPCTFPAYDSSQIACRSFENLKKQNKEDIKLKEIAKEARMLEIEYENNKEII